MAKRRSGAKRFSRREFLILSGALTMTALSQSGRAAAQTDPATSSENWQATGETVPELDSFETMMQTYMQERNIPNGSIAVTRNGKLVFARAYSQMERADMVAQPDSLFRLASLSKPITGAAIARLVMDGKLSLSDKLVDLLDIQPLSGQLKDARWNDITVNHLKHHTGGWDRDQSYDPMFRDKTIAEAYGVSLPITMEHIIGYMADQMLDEDPGSQYAYSNFGYCLLGRIVEVVSGQPYETYVKEHILDPIGAVDTRVGRTLPENRFDNEVAYYMEEGPEPVDSVMEDDAQAPSWPYGGWNLDNMDSHGGWLSSAVDLARFASAYDDPTTSPIIDEENMPVITGEPEGIPITGGHYYGGGWMVRPVNEKFNMWHNGSLDGTYTFIVRRWDGLNWVVLFNQRDDSGRGGYGAIDGLLHQAANAVTDWPDHDFFTSY